MSISLLNMGMLIGLIGLALPVIVHLLNRRRFDVVHWGAMQFLQLGERTRQRIKLSDLLLLLLRIGLIALLVLIFTRPLLQGGQWIRSLYPEPVDLVVIIDSSYSMGWTGETITPHARAIQVCHELLDDLTPADRVAIIDARQQEILLTPAPLTDVSTARLELEKLTSPDGTAHLAAAVRLGCQLLNQSFSARREIVVLTDGQGASWQLESQNLWNEVLQLKQSAAVPLQFSAIDVGALRMEEARNFQVEHLEASQDLVVVDVPLTITTRVKYTGPEPEARCELFWSVDGQRLSRETVPLTLRQGEEKVAQFTTRFTNAGSHVIAASVTPDELPGDDLSECVIQVLSEIPLVIAVNQPDEPQISSGIPQADYFLKRAFGDPDRGAVWVRSQIRDHSELTEELLLQTRLLILSEILPADFDWKLLTTFLEQGGAVVILPASQSTAEDLQKFNQWKIADQPVLPAQYERLQQVPAEAPPMKLDPTSLSGPWLTRFRAGDPGDLVDLICERYWEVTLSQTPPSAQSESSPRLSVVTVDARLQSGAPLFVRRYVGAGQILMSTIPFDGNGNDLVRLRSFVPFVHELVFGLTAPSSQRNVELGQSVVIRQLHCQPLTIPVTGPAELQLTAQRTSSSQQIQWVLAPPPVSGLYFFKPGCPEATTSSRVHESEFPVSVQASRVESDLERLTSEELDQLANTYSWRWQNNSQQLLTDLSSSTGGIEIWPLLLFLVTAGLVGELLLTRKLVQGGHIPPALVTETVTRETESAIPPPSPE